MHYSARHLLLNNAQDAKLSALMANGACVCVCLPDRENVRTLEYMRENKVGLDKMMTTDFLTKH